MTVLICCGGCNCPSDKPNVIPDAVQGPCCRCDIDEGIEECPANDPHPVHGRLPGPVGACACECDPGRAGQIGEYTPEFDEDGVMTANTWEGECPPNVPEFDTAICACKCTKDADTCAPKTFISEICDCKCTKTEDDCSAPNPELDPDSCSCGPCTNTCEDAALPDRDDDTCECKCDKDDPDGGNSCPEDTPDLKAEDCSCFCALAELETPCAKGEKFSPGTCSCDPCPTPCPENHVRDDVGCGCACPQPKAICASDETFDDETCSCVPSYASALLDVDLLP
jgi:hypothetical protein